MEYCIIFHVNQESLYLNKSDYESAFFFFACHLKMKKKKDQYTAYLIQDFILFILSCILDYFCDR